MMRKYALTATSLRLALTCSMFAIALLTSAAMYFAYGKLQEVAVATSHVVADANASQDNIQTLQKLEEKLQQEKDVVARANSIVASSQSYQYQNQIINDLNAFAGKAGIGITNIDFGEAGTPGSSSSNAQPAKPTAPAPPGLTATTVSVTLANPVPYDGMLRFIHAIEQNLTKMQISNVALAKGSEGNTITSEVLTIQVYLKKGQP